MSNALAPIADGKATGFDRLEDLVAWLSRPFGKEPDADYAYLDASGRLVGGVLRWNLPDGKQIRPVSRDADGRWHCRAMEPPRPLYRLPSLLKVKPDAVIWIVEGEKACEALNALLRNAGRRDDVATTWPGGCHAWHYASWEPLKGRKVVLWPDNDEPGRRAMRELGARLQDEHRCPVLIADPSTRFSLPKGADAADVLDIPALLNADSPARVIDVVLGLAEVLKPVAEERGIIPLSTNSGPAQALSGPELLDAVKAFLQRFFVYPSEAAAVAHTLWVAHSHVPDAFENTPRLAFLSPEPGSGKTRALELTATLVPNPVHAANVSDSFLFRKIGEGNVTVLMDEADTVFGFGKPTEKSEELRALLNAGHRRGAAVGRCIVRGKDVVPVEYPAFAPVALAGLRELPQTIASRSIVVNMRRRGPGETAEPFRVRMHEPQGHELRDSLTAWLRPGLAELRAARPAMPEGVHDRNADAWESLFAIADYAGKHWPQLARQAAASPPSLGVQLLADLKHVFAEVEQLGTSAILQALHELDEASWGDLGRGKPLDSRTLTRMLRPYGVRSTKLRIGTLVCQGYRWADLMDSWARYCPD